MTQDEYTLTSSDEAFALGERGRQVDLLYISDHVLGRRAARFFSYLLDDTRGRRAFIQEVVALSSGLREAGHANLLEAAYAATDPTLAPEYASVLMPGVPGRP